MRKRWKLREPDREDKMRQGRQEKESSAGAGHRTRGPLPASSGHVHDCLQNYKLSSQTVSFFLFSVCFLSCQKAHGSKYTLKEKAVSLAQRNIYN